MKNSQLKKIKPPKIQKGGSSFVAPGKEQEESDITLSFKLFNSKSIKLDDFNNYYENQNAAHKAVSDLLHVLNDISRETTKTIFQKGKKRQLHLNRMDDENSIRMIEKILLEGYGLPEQMIAEFDREYFEIVANGDGGRLIFVMSDHLMIPLFLDPNHLVYSKVSKNIKKKTGHAHPGFFTYDQEHIDCYKQPEKKNSLKDAVIEYARSGEYHTVDDFLKAWDDANSD